MSRLFDEVSALMRTGNVYIVDTIDGTWREFTAAQFIVVSPILKDPRFKSRLSLKSAVELSHQAATANAGRN